MQGEKVTNSNRARTNEQVQSAGNKVIEAAQRSTREQRLGREAARAGLERKQQAYAVDLQKFQDFYPEAKLKHDQDYARRTRSFLQEKSDNEAADWMIEEDYNSQTGPAAIFEQMFMDGVATGGWLGNVVLEDDKPKRVATVEVYDTADVDDLRNRVDSYVTFDLMQPVKDPETGLSIKQLALGFDVTITGDNKRLQEKLTKSTNDKTAQLPFGFSQIEYYEHHGKPGKLSMVPRYTVGVSKLDVRAIEETARTDAQGRFVHFDLNSGQNLVNRFKFLQEIISQNTLYSAMLPTELNTAQLKQACATLNAVDKFASSALDQCVQTMIRKQCLPKPVLNEVAGAVDAGRKVKARNLVGEYLLQRSQEVFAEEAKWAKSLGRRVESERDTFVQITELCDDLTNAAYDGELDQYRGIMSRSQAIELPQAEPLAPVV